MDEIFVNKLPISDSSVHMLTDWSADDIVIKVLALNNSSYNKWSGLISKEVIESSAEELSMPYNSFKNECKSALTSNNGKECFSYFLENGLFKLQRCTKFKITYFEIQLCETDEDLHSLFLNTSENIIEDKLQIITKKDENLKLLETEIVNLIGAYEKCKTEKNDLELTLFSKFMLLLNSKKNRIKKLEKILQNEGIQVNYSSKKNENQSLLSAAGLNGEREDIFENNNNDEYFDMDTQVMKTDEDSTCNILNLPKRQKVENLPSTSAIVNEKTKLLDKEIINPFEDVRSLKRKSPSTREDNSSEEYFARM